MAETISVRVSPEIKQELKEFAKDEKLEQTSEAARKLLAIGLEEWHRKRALRLFSLGRITLSKGAGLARMNVWDFAQFVKERGTPWIKDKKFIEKDLGVRI